MVQSPVILLLEDDLELGIHLARFLESEGYSVRRHQEARAAAECAKTEHIDLVLADIFIIENGRYSDEGGITLITRLRRMMKHHAPIIAMSGAFNRRYGRDDFQKRLEDIGADFTLAKPFHEEELLDVVVLALASKSGSQGSDSVG